MSDQKTTTEPMKYAPPQLVVYGAVTDLTAAGSNGISEGNSNDPFKMKKS